MTPPTRRTGRVLVIDDDPMVLRTLTRVLAAHDVIAEPDAARALERLLGEEPFDAIVCDVDMPSLSGPVLVARLSEARPELCKRVVLVTGNADLIRAEEGVADKIAACVEKPFEPAMLRGLVDRVVDTAARDA